MHPSLDAQLDMRSYRTETFGEYSIQTSHPAQAPDARIDFDAQARIGAAAQYVGLYPNFMLNRYGPCLDTNHVVPDGPDRCQVHYECFFQETEGEDARGFIEESIEQSAITQRKDIAICESVQIGLRSNGYERGRYAPRVEMGEHHFHRLLVGCTRSSSHMFGGFRVVATPPSRERGRTYVTNFGYTPLARATLTSAPRGAAPS
ncbi:MAG: hypothetical protein GY711_14615 [bacterium]|nr:hypothetical protein [bacterium]